ncbi:MAG: CCA tRNA nucleotidyltransferase [Planctomycetes bacterium]|nr:CCA tRNA nucleotidyltransferase [Planctomycetota bacterium]
MSGADPKREFAVDVVRTLQAAGFQALWAGGCVRDLLLRHPPDDYDVATSARPEQVQKLFPRRTLAIGASFGVILVQGPRRSGAGDVEVATFRTEGPYRDGRRPENVAFATAEEDAHRRDFTINGMFYDPLTEQVYDYVGGQDDLQRRVVRAIGDPWARFREDKLRMLRAVRMVARFDFALDPSTAAAVQSMGSEILVVSQERIAQELKKMLVHRRRRRALELAQSLQILTVIVPELAPVLEPKTCDGAIPPWQATLAALESLAEPRFELALATMLYDLAPQAAADAAGELAEQVCRRLRLSNQECHAVRWLVSHRDTLVGVPDWPLYRLKRLLAEPLVADLLTLTWAQNQARQLPTSDVEFCQHYLQSHAVNDINPPPLVNGTDLQRLGAVPGPHFKEWLDQARNAQLDGTIQTPDEALEFVRALMARHPQ